MTPAERNLLLVLANQRLAELKMATVMIDQELANAAHVPEQQKAFLVMQRAQIGSATQVIGGAIATIEQESRLVVGK